MYTRMGENNLCLLSSNQGYDLISIGQPRASQFSSKVAIINKLYQICKHSKIDSLLQVCLQLHLLIKLAHRNMFAYGLYIIVGSHFPPIKRSFNCRVFVDCIVQKIDNCLLFGSFSAVIINEPLCDLFSNYFNDHVTPPDVRN